MPTKTVAKKTTKTVAKPPAKTTKTPARTTKPKAKTERNEKGDTVKHPFGSCVPMGECSCQ